MGVAYIHEFAIGDRSTTNYDFVADKIGDGPFDGPGCVPEFGRLHSTYQRRLLRATPRGRVKRRLSRGPGPVIVLFVSA
jgi:hypothetical protein